MANREVVVPNLRITGNEKFQAKKLNGLEWSIGNRKWTTILISLFVIQIWYGLMSLCKFSPNDSRGSVLNWNFEVGYVLD